MSSKIDVFEIIQGHIETLENAANNQPSSTDRLTFFAVPLAIAVFGIFFSFTLKESLVSLLVNFGSILIALLLSVLVLIYDQEDKLDTKKKTAEKTKEAIDPFYKIKKKLLNQLYYNICYSIVSSLALVVVAFFQLIVKDQTLPIDLPWLNPFIFKTDVWISTPIAIFLACNLILTIIMIVKRMHALLTAES